MMTSNVVGSCSAGSGKHVAFNQPSCSSTLGTVTTCLWTDKLFQNTTNHGGQLSLPSPLSR